MCKLGDWFRKYGSSVILPIIALAILSGGIYLYANVQDDSISEWGQECIDEGNVLSEDNTCSKGIGGKIRELEFKVIIAPIVKECEEIVGGEFNSFVWSENDNYDLDEELNDCYCWKDMETKNELYYLNEYLEWQLKKVSEIYEFERYNN